MIRVRYHRMREVDPTEVWLDAATRAVAAEPYAYLDEGQGGITRSDLKSDDIKAVAEYGPGAEVFIESDDPTDLLDDTSIACEIETRVWWRAVVVGPAG